MTAETLSKSRLDIVSSVKTLVVLKIIFAAQSNSGRKITREDTLDEMSESSFS